MKRRLVVPLLSGVISCQSVPPLAPSASPRTENEDCGEQGARFDGGAYLRTEDSVFLWYKVAGTLQGPTLVYLHGGPCWGTFDFEKSVGPLLEKSVRIVYFEQRGCSRSTRGATEASLDMDSTIEDIERLRRHLGLDRLNLIAHSAGGAVALEYARKHADRIERLIMIEASADFASAKQEELEHIESIAPERFPDQAEKVRELAQGSGSVAERRDAVKKLIGGDAFFLHTGFPSEASMKELIRLVTPLKKRCRTHPMNAWYLGNRYLEGAHPELMQPLRFPTLAIAGRQSHNIGHKNMERSARAWGAELLWFENSGHFLFVDEPQHLADTVGSFIHAQSPGRSPGSAR